MLGALFAFVSAAFFGLNNAATRRGVLKSTVLQGMAITVPLGIPIFVAFALVMGGFQALAAWELPTWGWMALAGVVHFVLGRYGNYRATQALGSTLSTPVQQLSILVSLVLAMIFLGETLSLLKIMGIALIVVGPMLMVRRSKQPGAASAKAGPDGFTPEYGPGLFWGGVCALGYGISPLLIALGLGPGGGMADAVAGVMISYAAATVVVVMAVLWMGGPAYMRGMDGGSGFWFVVSAVFVALSQLFRYMALTLAPVSVVVPIQRLSVIFRLIFNALINRQHEVFDRWVVLTILLAVGGAVALAADGGVLLSFLGVPAKIAAVLAEPLW